MTYPRLELQRPFLGLGLTLLSLFGMFAAPNPAAASSLEAERNISLCSNETILHARPRLCNLADVPTTFDLQTVPLEADIGFAGVCTIDGPTSFVLTEEIPVLVPAQTCVDLHLEVAKPSGMQAQDVACYRILAKDLATGQQLEGQTSFADSGAVCGFPRGGTSTGLPAGRQVPMVFELYNAADASKTFNFQFESRSSEMSPPEVLLDGVTAGSTVMGQVEIPALGRADIVVEVALTQYDPSTRYDILLRDNDTSELLSSRGFRAFTAGCLPNDTTLCLNQGRFEVKVVWRDFIGQMGVGHSGTLTGDTGYFWFFDPNNIEVVLKVLDARYINEDWWVFFGALSSVEYTVTVRDTVTGESKSYNNPSGVLASVGDINALPGYETTAVPILSARELGDGFVAGAAAFASLPAAFASSLATEGSCIADSRSFCVQDGRFRVEATWSTPDLGSGDGQAVALTAETGYFWFFSPENVEIVLKVLDGRGINGHWWVFFGALSDVDYTLRITDTATGAVKVFHNAQGKLASVSDIDAFTD